MTTNHERMAELVLTNLRELHDFPVPGVLFRDMTPLLANGPAFQELIERLADHYRGKIDVVAGLESRGFILAAPLAAALGIGMIAIRKAGKLPGPVHSVEYDLEYGTATLELRAETVHEGERVLIVDDVLATGGTAAAAVELVEKVGGTVEGLFMLMELSELKGRDKLGQLPIFSTVIF